MKKATDSKKTTKAVKKRVKAKPRLESTEVEATSRLSTSSQPEKGQKETRKPDVRPYLFAAVILFAVCGLLIAKHLRNPQVQRLQESAVPTVLDLKEAEKFSDKIIEQLRNGQCTEISDQTSQGFQAAIPEKDWLEQCNTASGVLKGAAKDFKVADSNTEDDITEFSYKIAANDGSTYILTTHLVTRDGQWQLQGIYSDVE